MVGRPGAAPDRRGGQSTRLSEALGDAGMAALWARHDRVARDLLAEHRGREIDKTDGFMLLFDRAADAVAYALAYHRAIAPLGIAARAGIHVGPVILTENAPEDVARGAKPLEVDGIAKPTAARVMSVAIGGQTLLSEDAVAALGETGLRVESHGHWRMKGVGAPIQLFEVGEPGGAFAPPPDQEKVYRVVARDGLWLPVREVKRELPGERDAFVGRADDLRDLAALLEGSRLVSVLGMGGTGKTRLVTRFAWSWLGDYPGGAWFCDLSEARSVDGIAHAVATALDVMLRGGDPIGQLGHAIAGRGPCLVVLDNFEQVARHAPETIGRWLDRATEARFVVTTREVLGLPGEATLALSPLSDAEAAALFVTRAQVAKRDFALTEADRQAVGALVRLLDGLPLAIELAAARVRVMPPRILLQRMSERFKLLASSGGRQARQATLRAALDWSWDLLAPDEQAALAQLSVFAGGFTLEAAEAVLSLASLWPIDAVQALVDKSLVRPVSDDPRRMDLLVTVQDYASEKLGDGRGEAEARHGEYFAAFGDDAAIAALDGRDGVERLTALARELDNLIAACRRAGALGDGTTAAGAYAAAAQVLGMAGPASVSAALGTATLQLPLPGRERVRVEVGRCRALRMLGRSGEARAHLEEALAVARDVGDPDAEASALTALGGALFDLGQMEDARSTQLAALALYRAAGSRTHEAIVLGSLGNVCRELGRPEEARAHYEAALAAHDGAGHVRELNRTRTNLGSAHHDLGQHDVALRYFAAVLPDARRVGDRLSEALTLGNLGVVTSDLGRTEEAVGYLGAALVVHRELGNRRMEAMTLENLGSLLRAQGRPDDARAGLEVALAVAREVGDRRTEGASLTHLGHLHLDAGRHVVAGEHYAAALAVHRALGFVFGQAQALLGLTSVAAATGSAPWRPLADEVVALAAPYPVVHAGALRRRALLRLDAGDLAGARADVDAARAVPGASHAADLALVEARICWAEGRVDAALAAFREAEAVARDGGVRDDTPAGAELAAVRALLSGGA